MKIASSNFVKKLKNTDFYGLRIKAGNEIRIIIFTIDYSNFVESKKVVCLNGFYKKSNKNFAKAIKKADKILKDYL